MHSDLKLYNIVLLVSKELRSRACLSVKTYLGGWLSCNVVKPVIARLRTVILSDLRSIHSQYKTYVPVFYHEAKIVIYALFRNFLINK